MTSGPQVPARSKWHKWTLEGRGITTSEFWLTLTSIVATVGGVMTSLVPPPTAAVTLAILVAAYTISRGFVKIKKDS